MWKWTLRMHQWAMSQEEWCMHRATWQTGWCGRLHGRVVTVKELRYSEVSWQGKCSNDGNEQPYVANQNHVYFPSYSTQYVTYSRFLKGPKSFIHGKLGFVVSRYCYWDNPTVVTTLLHRVEVTGLLDRWRAYWQPYFTEWKWRACLLSNI